MIDRPAVLAIFGLTYVGMAIGRIPGLRTDRAGTGAGSGRADAVATGDEPRRAVGWVDLSTLALLFGLMVLSAKFGICGFYDYCADRITHAAGRRSGCWRSPSSSRLRCRPC